MNIFLISVTHYCLHAQIIIIIRNTTKQNMIPDRKYKTRSLDGYKVGIFSSLNRTWRQLRFKDVARYVISQCPVVYRSREFCNPSPLTIGAIPSVEFLKLSGFLPSRLSQVKATAPVENSRVVKMLIKYSEVDRYGDTIKVSG